MPLPAVCKRFEIWFLLVLAAGILAFALWPSSEPEFSPSGEETPGKVEAAKDTGQDEAALVELAGVRSIPSSGGIIVETVLAKRVAGKSGERFGEAVIARTSGGESVPRFFEPFRDTDLPTEEGSGATLRWWLEKPTDTLLLEIEGEIIRVPVP